MYGVVRNVIASKNYELKDMLRKLDTFWAQGSISEVEREELISLARNNAQADNSLDLLHKVEELDKRVKVLEAALASKDSTDEGTEELTEVTYSEYEAGKWYYAGDIVSFEGSNYKCIAPDGAVCVWSPTEYPNYWEEVVTE